MAKKRFGKLHLGSPRRTCEDNIRMNLNKISFKDVNRLSIKLNYGVQYHLCLNLAFY
jgi:hypothetical protein